MMKVHEVQKINRYYITMDETTKSNIGSIKPGTCQQKYISQRMDDIRKDEPNMKLHSYLVVYDTDKAHLEAIEGDVKADLVDMGFIHCGNDHFKFKYAKGGHHKEQREFIAFVVFTLAMTHLEAHNMKYRFIRAY